MCPPPPYSGISPPQLRTYFGTYLKNYFHNFPEILGSCSKQYKGNEFALTKKHDILPFEGFYKKKVTSENGKLRAKRDVQ